MKTFTFDFKCDDKVYNITVKYHSPNAFIISRQQHDFDSHEDYIDCLDVVKQLILYNEKTT